MPFSTLNLFKASDSFAHRLPVKAEELLAPLKISALSSFGHKTWGYEEINEVLFVLLWARIILFSVVHSAINKTLSHNM